MYASALNFAGLYTFPNPLSKVPEGAALQADNLVANKDGVAEVRRGFTQKGTSLLLDFGQFINAWFAYQNRLLINCGGTMRYDSDGTLNWSISPGTGYYQAPSGAVNIHGVEANKNFYITSNYGVQKLAAYNAQPIGAGVPPALDGVGVLAGAGTGFLSASFQCAYQIVFGYTDANGNLNIGNPSTRILVVNSTAGSDNVTLTFTVPQFGTSGTSELSTNYFYQIYRTPQTAYSATPSLNVPPGAELQLAAQYNLTSGQISALSVTFTDTTTDALLGTTLYTCPSQQGALQTNDRPPLCADLCVFNQMSFYANCRTLESTQLSLISVGAPNGIQVNDTVTISFPTTVQYVYTGKGAQNNAAKQFKVDTSGTVAQNIANTARNLVNCINANVVNTIPSASVYAFYISGDNSLPGMILLQCVNLDMPSLSPHFVVWSSRGGAFSPALASSGASLTSRSDTLPNGIFVSKVGQPEAAPAVNLQFVGGGDQPIYRVLPLRDRVIVLKSDGVYVITGSTPSTLSITLLDSTIICIAPESARLLNNSVYCMTNQGVVSITESGVTIQSRQIEGDLLQLTSPAYTNFQSCCQAVTYESERLYILGMPTNTTDTYATQAWLYNWVTNAWTRWPIDIASGLVNPADNKLYIARPSITAQKAFQERKNYLYTDFMDDQFSVYITNVNAAGTVMTLSATPDTSWVGYALDQTNAGIAIITAVNAGSKTITVDLVNSTTPNVKIPWTTGPAFVDVPIPITIVTAPITAGFPHYLKSWGRINFWFNGGNFQLITCGFINEVQGPTQYLASITTAGYGFGPFGATPYGGNANYPQFIQTLVPTDVSQSRWLQPSLNLSFPQARFSFLGSTVSYDIVSDVSG